MGRHNLYMFRHSRKLKQIDMAIYIGCTRNYYSLVETGKRRGNPQFWNGFQAAFGVPDSEMYTFMKLEGSE